MVARTPIRERTKARKLLVFGSLLGWPLTESARGFEEDVGEGGLESFSVAELLRVL